MTSVVVVDDEPIFRTGLVSVLRAGDLDVIAETSSGYEAVAVAARERPDLVFVGLALPEPGGLGVAGQIAVVCPQARVIVVNRFLDGESIAAALAAGVAGYIAKDAEPDRILAVIDAVLPGARRRDADRPPGSGSLTPREAAVARLMAGGLPDLVIAARLGLSRRSVTGHIADIIAKVGAAGRRDAIRRIRDGAGPPV